MPRIQRSTVILVVFWALLGARLVMGVARCESVDDALSLPTVAFFALSIVLGSRVYFFFRPAQPTPISSEPIQRASKSSRA